MMREAKQKTARSTYLRYREALGETIAEIPEGYYPGDYLKEVGQALAERDRSKWLTQEAEWLEPFREFAVNAMMTEIRKDLALWDTHEVFTSETELPAGLLKRLLSFLKSADLFTKVS